MSTTHDHSEVTGDYVILDGEQHYRIANSHLMPDFFMSLVGASDHWMFVSSNGALTAGRRNADNALFPYQADDQISIARSETGSTTFFRTHSKFGVDGSRSDISWAPFSRQLPEMHCCRRNLYKTPLGNKLVFEEINESLQMVFRYRWTFSEEFGIVRTCHLENRGQESRFVQLLDGLRNILPHGITADFQSRYSNLGNAYKRSELVSGSELGVFYLSSVPTDRAEPSEGLRATTVWQTGLTPDAILLSSNQIQAFLDGQAVQHETDVRGSMCAFLLNQSMELAPGQSVDWHIAAELAQDHSDVVRRDDWLRHNSATAAAIEDDIRSGERQFIRIVSSSDGIQCSSNQRRANRHLSNTVFNVMRGGIPLEDYGIHSTSFVQHVATFNRQTFEQQSLFLSGLPTTLSTAELRNRISEQNDPDLTRLGLEYLPLAFSRRHGDPTRPWNQFSIDLRSENGKTSLNYQGNWRDIFQNWEALGFSFPEFFPSMICRFVNATTADGYNPYRLTNDGFEWEEPTAEDPWANIGYWGDHQIIYLLKLLEWSRRFQPLSLDSLLNSPAFVHADVPYRIRTFEEIRENPRDTIEFDAALAATIRERVACQGADGKLLRNQQKEIHHVTLMEKLLTLSLAKLSNFIPDGGIWLNTQRPEWNDANNALVGNGLSIVTTCYLYRWFQFLLDWVSGSADESYRVSREVFEFFTRINEVLLNHVESLPNVRDPKSRLHMAEALSNAGSDYRADLYTTGLSGQTVDLARQDCVRFFEGASNHLAATIYNNKRRDGLYHSYNLLDWRTDCVEIEHLYEMLEGQVSALSSGLLSASEAVEMLDSLRQSALYRENQNSYLLYPDRDLPRFLEKNKIDSNAAADNSLVQSLLIAGDETILRQDVHGALHFNGEFRNSADLQTAIDKLDPKHESEVQNSRADLISIFENLFKHRQFTGRSATFFAYEGLGSIYWHMVSKLGLAVSEAFFRAIESGASDDEIESLKSHFGAIKQGIGAEKSPSQYGAFPSDPYSHTPENAGVKQPGMTGQVKEDVLARFSEIGIHIEFGCICFRLDLFDPSELVSEVSGLTFCDLAGKFRTIQVPKNGFGFTLFQVPFTYQAGETDEIRVQFADGKNQLFHGRQIDNAVSNELFSRSGTIIKVECQFTALRC